MLSDAGEQNCLDPEQQTEGGCSEEKELDIPEVLDEEQTEAHESQIAHTSETSLNVTKPMGKRCRLSRIRRHYTFKQTIENLHAGRPAYSYEDYNLYESTRNLRMMENLTNEIRGLSVESPPSGTFRKVGAEEYYFE